MGFLENCSNRYEQIVNNALRSLDNGMNNEAGGVAFWNFVAAGVLGAYDTVRGWL